MPWALRLLHLAATVQLRVKNHCTAHITISVGSVICYQVCVPYSSISRPWQWRSAAASRLARWLLVPYTQSLTAREIVHGVAKRRDVELSEVKYVMEGENSKRRATRGDISPFKCPMHQKPCFHPVSGLCKNADGSGSALQEADLCPFGSGE